MDKQHIYITKFIETTVAMKWNSITAFAMAALLQTTSALPTEERVATKLQIVKTAKIDNQVVDWVIKDSQGEIASPPPRFPSSFKRSVDDSSFNIKQALFKPLAQGPAGSVPIARHAVEMPAKRLPTASDNDTMSQPHITARYAGTHWYASSNQNVLNHGGGARFSIYNTYLESPYDFSLLQTAVTVDSAPQLGGGTAGQTVEAGWMHYPYLLNGDPFLFTYYTTNGYSRTGDNQGGYNRNQAGWVQVDKEIYPGIRFTPFSTRGGAQVELLIEFVLYQGNWWLFVLDRYIGYYPASLFSIGVDPAKTLATHSNAILFYGEVINSNEGITTTDMGSGNFPDAGYGQSAFIRNIVYIDGADKPQFYDSQGNFVVSDNNRYRIQPHWKSGSDWGSFCFLGGPGAGGVVDG